MLALLAVAALACLVADPPPAPPAPAAPADPWLGQLVMLRADGLWIEFPDEVGVLQKRADLCANSVYRVLKTGGNRLWLREKDQEGWLPSRDALLMKDAVPFFTARIAENPAAGKFYGRRATASQTLRRNDGYMQVGVTPQGADFASALADLTVAIRLEPATAKWWGDRAVVRCQLQQYDGACDDAAEAIRLRPTKAEWYYRRGLARKGKGEPDAALRDFDEAIRLGPSEPAYWNARGTLWAGAKGDDRKAVADYTEAIRLDPKEALYHSNRGLAHTELKEYDKALADLGRASDSDPHWALPHFNRGVVYRERKQWAEAIKAYALAIERAPKDVANWWGRAAAHDSARQFDRAALDYAECLRLAPNDEEVLGAYAWFCATCPEAKHRDGAKAVESARKAVALDAEEADHHDILAAALAETGDFAAAVSAQERALKLMRAKAARDAEAIASAEARLALYRAGKPYRATGGE